MSVGRFLQQGAAGNAGEAIYVDDVFSTYLHTGNSSTQTITNGIDLDGEGGMVWVKNRNQPRNNQLYDTARGVTKRLKSNHVDAEYTSTTGLTSFNSNGFSIGTDTDLNANNDTYASWTFRKQPGFFDVVTYTGDGTTTKTVSHNLGATPGMIVFKRTDSTGNWIVWHRSTPNGSYTQAYQRLNGTFPITTLGEYGNSLVPTDSVIKTPVHSNAGNTADSVNVSGATYVAYLFAHDAQDFGTDSDESIIKCGSYTEPSSGTWLDVNLGFEAQWVMVKSATSASQWTMFDVMRDATGQYVLQASSSNVEQNFGSSFLTPTATGFQAKGGLLGSGQTIIYVAIRRPHKPAEELEATGVFSVKNYAATTSSASVTHDVAFDMEMSANRDVGTAKFHFVDQLRGINGVTLRSSNTSQELSYPTFWSRQNMYTMYAPSQFDSWWASSSGTQNHISYALKRAPGFFDVVAYTGTGVSGRTVTHNLNAVPELMIVKCRSDATNWAVYDKVSGGTKYMVLNAADASSTGSNRWNDTNPTDSVFTVGDSSHVNSSVRTYVAYLFATVDGISKVGSYTGTGSDVDVNCGFTSGARFVLVKRTDSTGDWFVWDSVRGIVSGNDPYLRLNSETAEVTTTDYIDPLSSGFTITSSAPAELNASGGTYIFLAIA